MVVQDNNGEILFLNTPIESKQKDIIGINTYVKKLNAAIEEGAQMIAVTSPFGSGKSSISELLEESRKDATNEKVIKISMWSQMHGDNKTDSTTDLHRAFVYQLASQINHKKGTYISKRLNPNYGMFKAHVNKKRYWVLFVLAILCISLSIAINSYQNVFDSIFHFTDNNRGNWISGIFLIGLSLLFIVSTCAEIIYSYKHDNWKKKIESAEIIDLYRNDILKYDNVVHRTLCRIKNCKLFKKIKWIQKVWLNGRFIVVVEDLDRTDDPKAVINFLKELRKYYIPSKNMGKYCNKVVFIVNVMPEAMLTEKQKDADIDKEKTKDTEVFDKEQQSTESLYAKLFDFSLNLQTINVDNYDAILDSLLLEKEEEIRRLGICVPDKLSDIPGMKWIIRERRIGIREIKERLNIAFSLYESLKRKFPKSAIGFDKCAVVAYLTTAFEKDFFETDDRAFQRLVYLFLQNELTDINCEKQLKGASPEYVKTVKELIVAKLIDNNYRTYFYNYPKGSYLYSLEEQQVIDAILYDEEVENLEKIAKTVIGIQSFAPKKALQTRKQLGLLLPDAIFNSETLYIEVLKESSEDILAYLEHLDYTSSSATKTIVFILKMLSYDKERKIYSSDFAKKLCALWERHFSEDALNSLRLMLCRDYSSEILWYQSLFFGVHAIAIQEELDCLNISQIADLVNTESEDFSYELAKYILRRFNEQQETNEKITDSIERFLRSLHKNLDEKSIVLLYLGYMNKVCKIIPDFEEEVHNLITNDEKKDEDTGEVIIKYQTVVNNSIGNWSEKTIEYIREINHFKGLSLEAAEEFNKQGAFFEYVLTIMYHDKIIPFEKNEIRECLEKNVAELVENKKRLMIIRNQLALCQANVIWQYLFMYKEKCPILTAGELHAIETKNKNSDKLIIEIVPAQLVTEENYKMLSDYFSRKKQGNNLTFEILKYISSFSPEVSEMCFYSLDFDMIQFYRIAKTKKDYIKKAFFENLKLTNASEKLKFMKTTKCIDSEWEEELKESIKNDSELENEYVAAVNASKTINRATIQTVCSLHLIHAMSLLVNQKLFEYKKYTIYISSLCQGTGRFDIDEAQKDVLWPYYIKIFASDSFPTTRKYMVQNHEFLRMVMKNKEYVGFSEENRLQLKGIYQDKDSILNVMEYGVDFALQYYSSMAGFEDLEAATAFVTIVENTPKLIASKELYNNTHGKLINGILKARYTNIRKRNGYEK